MLQRFLFIALTLCSLSATAQWQQTGSKVRYVNGLGIPTKDTAAGVTADSSQILIRPADSALYIKYKRTWLRVGGGGGSIAGSGTTNYIPKFTSSTAIGNSQIFDNGTKVGIGYGGVGAYKFGVQYTQASNTLDGFVLNANTLANNYGIWSANAIGGGLFGLTNPYTGFINYTDAAALSYINNGSGYFSWHNSSAELMRLTNDGNVGIGTASPQSISGYTGLTINGTTGGFQFFQVNGSNVGRLLANATDYYTDNVSTGSLIFRTNGASPTERMRITSAGDIQIGGIVPPTNRVDIFAANRASLSASGSGLNVNYGGTNTAEFATMGFSWASSIGSVATLWGMGLTGTNYGSGQADLFFFTQSNRRMTITAGGDVGIGTTSPAAKLSVQGTTLINTNTDNGVDKLQVSGSMNVSTLATTNNLSVTTNATVGGTLKVTGSTTLGTTNTGALTASSLDVTSGSGTFANLYSNGLVQMLGVNVKYRNISATYTATTGDDYFINITSGTFTLNLPTAATPYGQVYVIKNSGTGTVTLDPFSTQTIDGSTTVTMNVQNQTYTIIGDGSNWKIVSKYL